MTVRTAKDEIAHMAATVGGGAVNTGTAGLIELAVMLHARACTVENHALVAKLRASARALTRDAYTAMEARARIASP